MARLIRGAAGAWLSALLLLLFTDNGPECLEHEHRGTGGGFTTAQWQPNKLFVLSAGLRWDLEAPPPALPKLANSGTASCRTNAEAGQQLGSARVLQHGPCLKPSTGAASGLWHVLRSRLQRSVAYCTHANWVG